jgi:hypothetical protein
VIAPKCSRKVLNISNKLNNATRAEPLVPAADCSARIIAGWGEGKKEGAAIVEYDRDIPRDWSEGLASLNTDHPSADVPPRRWGLLH